MGASVNVAAAGMMVQSNSPALPCPGSVGQQPAALMDAFAMLDMWAREPL